MTTQRAVLLDFGGVLTSNVTDSFTQWVVEQDVDGPSAAAAITGWLAADGAADNPLHRLETGSVPADEFEAALAGQLRHRNGGPVSPEGLLDGLFAAVRPDEQMWEIVGRLRSAGHRVGLLSNSWGDRYPHDRLAGAFDDVVISEQVGLRKPDPAIYELAATRIGVPAARCVFIDDLDLNVTAAEAVGMTGVHHLDAGHTAARLVDLTLLAP